MRLPSPFRFAFLDAAGVSAVIFDLEGRPIHRTPAVADLGLTDAEERELEVSARTLARGLAAASGEGGTPPTGGLRVTRPLRLGRREFRPDADRLCPTDGSGGLVVLVTIRDAAAPLRDALHFR